MKKKIFLTLLFSVQFLWPDIQQPQFSKVFASYHRVLEQDFINTLDLLVMAPGMSQGGTPMPSYFWSKREPLRPITFNVGITGNLFFPFFKSKFKFNDYKDIYQTPLAKNLSEKDIFKRYDFGLRLSMRPNGPLSSAFTFRMGYYIAMIQNPNYQKSDATLKKVFGGDNVYLGSIFHRMGLGIDWNFYRSPHFESFLGMDYTAALTVFSMRKRISIEDIQLEGNVDQSNSQVDFFGKFVNHFVSLNLTAVYKPANFFNLYGGVIVNFLVAQDSFTILKALGTRLSPGGSSELYYHRQKYHNSLFIGTVYTGFQLYVMEFTLRYTPRPNLLELSIGVNIPF